MTKEQRAAIARLRNECIENETDIGMEHWVVVFTDDLEIILDMLADTDSERAMVVRVPRPDRFGSCSGACPLYSLNGESCCAGCDRPWVLVAHDGEEIAEEAAPGPGCPWYEEEA